ncbi:hypothetical protein AnigIFM56816_004438 [Aspergillus niger]|nr:hypothetical protein AnigIFM56816_004438 [Aspergillus niger]
MANSHHVFLLQYARFHGIATDYTDPDPLQHIDDICGIPPNFLHPPEDAFSAIEQNIASSQRIIEQDSRHEKLDIRREGLQFLSSVLRDIKRDNIDDCWEQVLPSWYRYDDLKLELPLFTSDNDSYLALPAEPLRYPREENILCSIEGLASDYDSIFSSDMIHKADVIGNSVSKEKLDCSKDALLLIQDARQAGNRPPDLDDLLRPFNDVAKEDQFKLQSPSLLPLNDDCFPCDSPPPSSSDRILLSPLRHVSPEVPTDVNTMHYEGYSGAGNDPKSTVSILKTDLEDQDPEEVDRQLTHDPPLKMLTLFERDSPGGMSIADIDTTNERRFESDFEQIIMAVTISTSPSSVTSQVTYTEITDNIATSDCFPYDNCIVNDLPSRPSYSPIPSACSSSHQETYVHEYPDCSAQPASETPVPELHLLTPTIEGDLSVTSCLPEILPEFDEFISSSSQSLLRKRKLDDTQEDSKKKEDADQKAIPSTMKVKTPFKQNPTTSLGSLSRFMETRGQASIREVATQSHYFMDNRHIEITEKEHDVSLHTETSDSHPTLGTAQGQSEIISFNQLQIPRCLPRNHEHIVLSLSTSLLKSHLRIVKCVESMSPATSIIYREPSAKSWKMAPGSRIQNASTLLSNCDDEADIIIARNTGIVLTTSQATTQVFLPGHKSSIMGDIPSVNSPLRERVFRLGRKYEKLYVLISHCSGMTSNLPDTGFTIDKAILSSLTAFTAFCSSMANLNIYPVVIPSSPDIIAGWILVLAGKLVNSQN